MTTFTGNRRLIGFGAALLLVVGVLQIGVVRSVELDAGDPVRVLAMVVLGLLALVGLAFVVLPDRLRIVGDQTIQIVICGIIPSKVYKQAAFKGLWVDCPPTQVDFEFASGRRLPFYAHKDPFVVLEMARNLSRTLKWFVRHEEWKLFKDGNPPKRPNFYLQYEQLDMAVVQSRFPLAESRREGDGWRFKLLMARALPNGERGLTIDLSPSEGLRILAEGMPQLVHVPLHDVVDIHVAPGYLGILTRDQGVLKLKGVGAPTDRYLVAHLVAAMRDLNKEDKYEPGKSEM